MGNVIPFQQTMYEMIGPSLSPFPPRGTLGQANTGGPKYFDANGKPITSIQCGGAFTFDVPGSGLSQIWLTIYKDGKKTYDGLFAIPMQSYITSCDADVGAYQVIAYDPKSGIVLGQTSMTITAAGGGTDTGGSGITSWFQNMGAEAKLLLFGGGALFLMMRHRRKKK